MTVGSQTNCSYRQLFHREPQCHSPVRIAEIQQGEVLQVVTEGRRLCFVRERGVQHGAEGLCWECWRDGVAGERRLGGDGGRWEIQRLQRTQGSGRRGERVWELSRAGEGWERRR